MSLGKITIDFDTNEVLQKNGDGEKSFAFDTPEAFQLISKVWLRSGWDVKYAYSFSWFGRPIIQLPEDMLRIQELIYSLRPDIIIETGIAHGGSLIFYASIMKAMGKGKVVGVDIDIRAHNRAALESHELASRIHLIEGSSVVESTLESVRKCIEPKDTVLVVLDSCHTKEHVAAELAMYAPLVSKNSYIIATDGVMKDFAGAPRSQPDWTWNNPQSAVFEFLEINKDFVLEPPPFAFNEGQVTERVTYWPNSYLKRLR